jgi:hypothetical protein
MSRARRSARMADSLERLRALLYSRRVVSRRRSYGISGHASPAPLPRLPVSLPLSRSKEIGNGCRRAYDVEGPDHRPQGRS